MHDLIICVCFILLSDSPCCFLSGGFLAMLPFVHTPHASKSTSSTTPLLLKSRCTVTQLLAPEWLNLGLWSHHPHTYLLPPWLLPVLRVPLVSSPLSVSPTSSLHLALAACPSTAPTSYCCPHRDIVAIIHSSSACACLGASR
ncbi:uncharacterized protein PV07_00323 [Cladophialophora immunda]|uniref:Secreted protein n=1 Tax=Cladophialophora immunda TaxID=569365 RepID=A0A0D2B7C7_9EURO|nr:uncharacterized protein PV07_00323 [Cladophialophora immunda]KIW33477.1 hypothetical protein PV07_00323 [Cladophialophora immunda]